MLNEWGPPSLGTHSIESLTAIHPNHIDPAPDQTLDNPKKEMTSESEVCLYLERPGGAV